MRPATNCLWVFLFYVSIVLSSVVVLLPFRRKPHLPSPMHSTKFKICSGDFCFFPLHLRYPPNFPKWERSSEKNLVLLLIIAFKISSQMETGSEKNNRAFPKCFQENQVDLDISGGDKLLPLMPIANQGYLEKGKLLCPVFNSSESIRNFFISLFSMHQRCRRLFLQSPAWFAVYEKTEYLAVFVKFLRKTACV